MEANVDSSSQSLLQPQLGIMKKMKEKLKGLLKVLDKCKEYKRIILTGDLNAKA